VFPFHFATRLDSYRHEMERNQLLGTQFKEMNEKVTALAFVGFASCVLLGVIWR
jgi:hypothetical protein